MTLHMDIVDGKSRYYVDGKEVPERVWRPLWDAWLECTAGHFRLMRSSDQEYDQPCSCCRENVEYVDPDSGMCDVCSATRDAAAKKETS